MVGERGHVRVVEHRRVGHDVLTGQSAVHPVAQLDRHQRVHAEVEESDRGRRRGRQAQHSLQFPLNESRQRFLPIMWRPFPQLREQVGGGCAKAVLSRRFLDEQFLEEGGPFLEILGEQGPVHRRGHACGHILAHHFVERLEALLGVEPCRAGRLQLALDPLSLLFRFAKARPRAPGDGLPRKPQRPAVGGQLVQEGVGGGVIALPGVPDDACEAGEQHEHIQVAPKRGLVQPPGAQHLRP